MLKLRCRHDIDNTVNYFTRDPALSEEEKQGLWMGEAARGLQLNNVVVEGEALRSMLSGFSPDGLPICARRSATRRSGWEVMLAPHKSISVAARCADGADSARIREAWDATCATMVEVIEALAVRQNAGEAYVPTRNIAAAVFTHTLSRHGDPHLHAHILVMNATFDPGSKRWRSLEPSPIYKAQKALDQIFHRELCRELRIRGLNAKLNPATQATELPVPESACVRLSTAHRIITERAKALPESLTHLNRKTAENRINDRTRPPKRTVVAKRPSLTVTESRHFNAALHTPKLVERPLSIPEALKNLERALVEVSCLLNTRSRWRAVARVATADMAPSIRPIVHASSMMREQFALPSIDDPSLERDEVLAIRTEQILFRRPQTSRAETLDLSGYESPTPRIREDLEEDRPRVSSYRQ